MAQLAKLTVFTDRDPDGKLDVNYKYEHPIESRDLVMVRLTAILILDPLAAIVEHPTLASFDAITITEFHVRLSTGRRYPICM